MKSECSAGGDKLIINFTWPNLLVVSCLIYLTLTGRLSRMRDARLLKLYIL